MIRATQPEVALGSSLMAFCASLGGTGSELLRRMVGLQAPSQRASLCRLFKVLVSWLARHIVHGSRGNAHKIGQSFPYSLWF